MRGRDRCYSGTSMGQVAAGRGPLNKSLAAARTRGIAKAGWSRKTEGKEGGGYCPRRQHWRSMFLCAGRPKTSSESSHSFVTFSEKRKRSFWSRRQLFPRLQLVPSPRRYSGPSQSAIERHVVQRPWQCFRMTRGSAINCWEDSQTEWVQEECYHGPCAIFCWWSFYPFPRTCAETGSGHFCEEGLLKLLPPSSLVTLYDHLITPVHVCCND